MGSLDLRDRGTGAVFRAFVAESVGGAPLALRSEMVSRREQRSSRATSQRTLNAAVAINRVAAGCTPRDVYPD